MMFLEFKLQIRITEKNHIFLWWFLGSNTLFDSTQFTIEFKDDSGVAPWGVYKLINNSGSFRDVSNGWYKYYLDINNIARTGGTPTRPILALIRNKVNIRLSSSSGKIYVFKDIKLEFNQQLTDRGVQYYRQLDSDNNKKTFINMNRNVMDSDKKMLLNVLRQLERFGNTDENTIQVKHIGSTVRIMWPRQSNSDYSVKRIWRFKSGPICW